MVLTSDKTPVLLIRGLLRESRHWLDFPEGLSARLQRPVFTLDLAGCGSLYQKKSATTVPELRAQLQQQWALLYPEYQGQPVDLVAISMGAMLALDWALSAPVQVRSVALINSSSASLSPFWQRLLPRNYLNLMSCLLAGPILREELIWRMTSNSAPQPDVLAAWQHWAIQCPVSRLNAVRQLWAASRFRFVQIPQCRLMVIASTKDQLVSSACSRALAEKLNAPLFIHPTAGHDLPMDAADWLIELLATQI